VQYALRNKVALISPTNFLVTMRTVASLWSVHKQNNNAQEIAGKLTSNCCGKLRMTPPKRQN